MPPETVPDMHPWLVQFPAQGRYYVVAWFSYAVSQSQGAQTPEAILEVVAQVCSRKLDWSGSSSTTALCQSVLLALAHQRPGALAYAATFLPREPTP